MLYICSSVFITEGSKAVNKCTALYIVVQKVKQLNDKVKVTIGCRRDRLKKHVSKEALIFTRVHITTMISMEE